MPKGGSGFAGTIWLQQGSAPLADDVEEILRGGTVLAARIMSRLAAAHRPRVITPLGNDTIMRNHDPAIAAEAHEARAATLRSAMSAGGTCS